MKSKTRAELEQEVKVAIALYKKAKRRAEKAEASLEEVTRDMNLRLRKFCDEIRRKEKRISHDDAVIRSFARNEVIQLRASWEDDDAAIIAKARGAE